MSEFYSSNADSVKDFLNNYTDTQIEGMEDMSSSLNNQLSLKWRAEFDQAHAKALEEGQLAGEALGGLLGVKGLYKGVTGGYKKLNDIYKKGKAIQKKVKDLQEKVTGQKQEDSLDDDLEDTDNQIPSKAKGNTEEEGDQDETDKTPDTGGDDIERGEQRLKDLGEDDDEDLGDLDDFDPQGALDSIKQSYDVTAEVPQSQFFKNNPDIYQRLQDNPDLVESIGKQQALRVGQNINQNITDDIPQSKFFKSNPDIYQKLQDNPDLVESIGEKQALRVAQKGTGEDEDETDTLGRQEEPTGETLTEGQLVGQEGTTEGARVVGQTADISTSDVTEDIGKVAEQDIGATEGALNQYASSVASRIAARGANIRQMAQGAYKTVTKYATNTVQKGSEDAVDDGEEAEGEEAEAEGEEVGAEAGEEAGTLGLDLAIGAVPVVGELATVGFGVYEGIKSLVDIFEPDTPKPPKPKALGGVLSGGNPLNIGSDGGQASKLTSGVPTMSDVQDVSNSLSF